MTFDPAPIDSAHPHVPLAGPIALTIEQRLGQVPAPAPGLPAGASAVTVSRTAGGADPDIVALSPLPVHGPRTWLNALEGLGTGPGALARKLGLASLLRPDVAALAECLPNRTAFAPAFRLAGQDYLPDRWERVRVPETLELGNDNREALLVTYTPAVAGSEIRALVLPSLHHAGGAPLSYVDSTTLDVSLSGAMGQTSQFDNDWPAQFVRRVSEAFDLTARLADPEIARAIYHPPAPVPPVPPNPAQNDGADWDAFLRRVSVAAARDASGTGIMATAGRAFPVARLLNALAQASGDNQSPLPPGARDAVLSALAAYETRYAAAGWPGLFAAFIDSEDRGGSAAARTATAELAARGALLTRQDVTATLLLRQWRQALAGPDGTGYALAANDILPIAQAYVSEALTGKPTGWVTLIPTFTGGVDPGQPSLSTQPFELDFTVSLPGGAAGDLLTLRLAADPVGLSAGGQADLVLTLSAAGAQWMLAGAAFGAPIPVGADQTCRLVGMITIDDGHAPVKLALSDATAELPQLGSRPPTVEVLAIQAFNLRFGSVGLPDLIGRAAQADPSGVQPLFISAFTERLAKLDPQGWLVQAPPTLAGALASGAAATPVVGLAIRERMLAMVSDAFSAWITARFDPALHPPLLPLSQDAADVDRLAHLRTVLIDRFTATYGKAEARESTLLVPLDSGTAVDLPIPDAHPIVVPYDLGDAIATDDLVGETTGVAVLVQADGRAFAPDAASTAAFADTFTLNAARVQYPWNEADQELAVGSRPTAREGADIRTFAFQARPLVAPLTVEQSDADPDELYALQPFDGVDADVAWGRTIPQMRFGWMYSFRSFLVAQGGALPPSLWRAGDPAALRRPLVDEPGFSAPVHYLCRTPIAAPRWDQRQSGSQAKRVPEGARPLAAELPDLPPPIDIPEGETANFYLSEQDGSGILPFAPSSKLDIKIYGLSLGQGGEAVLALRQGRLGAAREALVIRIRGGALQQVAEAAGEILVVLPEAKRDTLSAADTGEWHLQFIISWEPGTISVAANLLMEADAAGNVATLEPDLVHVSEPLGDATLAAAVTANDIHIAIGAVVGAARIVPPRVWIGSHRQVCPETAGQQAEIAALDSRTSDAVFRARPPAVPLSTWVRHVLSATPLGSTEHNRRINSAYTAAQQPAIIGNDTTLDHPRVTALFLEVVPLFPRTRTSGALLEIPLRQDTSKDPHGDRKLGLELKLRRGPPANFDPDAADIDVVLAGSQATVTIPAGRTVEVRVYAAVDIDDFEGPKARFSAALARGRRRVDRHVLGAPLRLRAEASADQKIIQDALGSDPWRNRFTNRTGNVFVDWGKVLADGTGRLQRVEARPTLAAPQTRAAARVMRLFADVTVLDQRWTWRGRTGGEAPPADDAGFKAYGAWAQRLFTGREDTDAEREGPVALTPYHIRRRDRLDERPETPLVMRDMTYRGNPTLWRFALEFQGRYPSEPGFNRRTLEGPNEDLEDLRHARWAHVLARGAIAPSAGVSAEPPEPRRPGLELWLPLAEQLREASAAAPVMLLFNEPWHALGNLGDRLQLVSLLTRHPLPEAFVGHANEPGWRQNELRSLFGNDNAIEQALQYPTFWQSWGPDPILTGKAAPFASTSLSLSGPLGWTQSEGASSDFRRSSFIVEPQVEPSADTTLTERLAARPLFQLLYRRLADPELIERPAGLLSGLALWQWAEALGTITEPRRRLAWRFSPPKTAAPVPVPPVPAAPNCPYINHPLGFQGLRLDWTLPIIDGDAPIAVKIEDDVPPHVIPRRLAITIERQGDDVRLRAAMSEPLMDPDHPGWRINHLPPIEFPALDNGSVQLRIDISPTAPVDPNAAEEAPDTFDVIVWARPGAASTASERQWRGGMLARLKTPEGKGTLRIDLPGTPEILKDAQLQPFSVSAFSSPFWVQFFGDSSRFRCRPASLGPAVSSIRRVEDLAFKISGGRAMLIAGGAATAVHPLPNDEQGTPQAPAPGHRLIAVVTRWITNAEGRLSEMPVFAAPLNTSDAAGSSIGFPSGFWPTAGRVRLLTVLATKEARSFGTEDEPLATSPFRILDAVLKAAPVTPATPPNVQASPFDLDTVDSELREAQMMVIGVSRPIELG
ncbi:hypothetical protein KZ820_07175 [Sphingomonas sp. RRHST34]|uniref:Uncharacterized protein n=1 Tax=Sphingomonas citri TaxID=2862499 RepID=A0ABS7BLN0_9SPHN|nr:hypothetical protein [Sphingomonas citri]MBW6530514.1 hypothetical protein [Sphingomonas citri]